MSKKQDLDRLLEEFVKNGPSGCGCAVARKGETIYEGYFGYADREKQIPLTQDSVFRLYSMTKVIICTAAMMLFERGKFLLNEPISEYFPEWKNTMKAHTLSDGRVETVPVEHPILVKHCFSMGMGIGYGGDDLTHREAARVRQELRDTVGKYTLRQDIRAMSQVPIAFEPGTHFLYGFGHELVAGLIEVASGKTVGQFLKEEIFEPLGMTSTGYRFFDDIESRMVVPYERDMIGRLAPSTRNWDERHQPDEVYEAGGAGLFSTVRDYLTFTQMLANGGKHNGQQIIGRKTIDLMRQNQLCPSALEDFTNSYNAGYGYGLGVRTMMDLASGNCNTSVGEFGWTGMMGTWTAIDPSEGVSAVYMHNMLPNMEEYHHLRVRAAAFGLVE